MVKWLLNIDCINLITEISNAEPVSIPPSLLIQVSDQPLTAVQNTGTLLNTTQNIIIIPVSLPVSNCTAQSDGNVFITAPIVTADPSTTSLTELDDVLGDHRVEPGDVLVEKPTSVNRSDSPEIDPEKVIMDLEKSSEWEDISAVKETVISPQLDLLELQWKEIIGKDKSNDLGNTSATDNALSSDNTIPDNLLSESTSKEIILPNLTDVDLSLTNSTPSTADMNELWSNTENNNYVLHDAVSLLGTGLTFDDSNLSNNDDVRSLLVTNLEQSTSDISANINYCDRLMTNNGTDMTSIDEVVNKCKCDPPLGKKMGNCCVTVCLRTLNCLRKLPESGCCRTNTIANSSPAAVLGSLPAAATANCCSTMNCGSSASDSRVAPGGPRSSLVAVKSWCAQTVLL